jgi:hypothetical protein
VLEHDYGLQYFKIRVLHIGPGELLRLALVKSVRPRGAENLPEGESILQNTDKRPLAGRAVVLERKRRRLLLGTLTSPSARAGPRCREGTDR